jgi:hypothetical protein
MKPLLIFGSLLILSFSRADYKHWIDADNDCQNTRDEVLIAESLESPVLDKKGCKVQAGKWHDKYTGAYITNPGDLDIDHLVPLAEVDRSGGNKWSKEIKIAYANDLSRKETLIAVSASQNRAKSDKDPANWMPKNKEYHCQYLKNWLLVKKTWKLAADEKEKKFIEKKLKSACNLKN